MIAGLEITERFFLIQTLAGDIIKFNCFQHSQTNEITYGTKYEIFIKVKRKELVEKSKYII